VRISPAGVSERIGLAYKDKTIIGPGRAVLPHVSFRVKIQNRKGGHQMSDRETEIFEEALSLPPGERAALAERLLSSLDTPDRQRVDQLWAREAEDRLDAYEQGGIEAVPAERIFDQIGSKTK